MNKKQIANQFAKSIMIEERRKNKVTTQQITNTLITAALNLAFVNETCKSSGKVSKSQVIYRKLEGKTSEEIQICFNNTVVRFLGLLKILSRNRKFIISFDTTKEAFYGQYAKADDKIYLHKGSIEKESYFYYEYITASITCNVDEKFILDGIIVPQGFYQEDYVKSMAGFIKDHLPVDVFLFDRGFNCWGVIYELKNLKVHFLIFWKKQGDWYKPKFASLSDGQFKRIIRKGIYKRNKTNIKLQCHFILIKQLEYEAKTYDWIFATNVNLSSAVSYVKRYKKRWGIETTYGVIDDIRVFTTSTKAAIRCFLFLYTCFVYNIWRYFQQYLGEDFTLANFKTNMLVFMAEKGMIHPTHYSAFKGIGAKLL